MQVNEVIERLSPAVSRRCNSGVTTLKENAPPLSQGHRWRDAAFRY